MKFGPVIAIIMIFAAAGFAAECAALSSVLNPDGSINGELVSPSQMESAELQVVEINQAIEEGNASWAAGITPVMFNKPSLMTDKSASTEVKSSSSKAPLFRLSSVRFASAAPPYLDLRNYNGTNYVTSVKDQGTCGSCWAFAATSSVESAFNFNIGLFNPGNFTMPFLDLSEQQQVSCNVNCFENTSACNLQCAGGYAALALDYGYLDGAVNETCMPYTSSNGVCAEDGCRRYFTTGSVYIGNTIDDREAIKENLQYYGALVFDGFPVYMDFHSYDNGTYSHVSGAFDGYHSMTLVGYNDTGQYWIVKNSWDYSWGEEGYVKIAYDFGSNASRDYADIFGVVDTDIDSDGVADSTDNCPFANNSDQFDSDNNSIGDACELLSNLTTPENMTYSPGKAYEFSITAGPERDSVWYSINGTDYSPYGAGNVFSFNLTDVPAEYNISYAWHANDTSGRVFSSSGSALTLKAAGSSSILLNGNSSSQTFLCGTVLNISAYGQGTVAILVNGTNVSSGAYSSYSNISLVSGYYNLTAASSGDQNYTSSSAEVFLTVQGIEPALNLTANGLSSDAVLRSGQPAEIVFSTPGPESASSFYVDGALNHSGSSSFNITLSPGQHNITAHYAGNENYTQGNMSILVNQTALRLEIIRPANAVYNGSFDMNVSLNATLSFEDSCWWKLSNGTNSAPVSCSSINGTESFSDGIYVLTVYANDSYGNTADDSVTFAVSEDGSVFVINSTNFTASNETAVLVIPAENAIQNITIPSEMGNQSVLLDMGLNFSEGNSTLGQNLTVYRNSSSANCLLQVQEGTVFSGVWNGTFELPSFALSSAFTAPSGNANVVIGLGADSELNLSKPAKLVLAGMKGKSAAWSRNSTLTKIETVCSNATDPSNINGTGPRECYANSGNDLVIWTYHFTSFAAYTPQKSSGGGGGGSSSYTAPRCTEGSVKCVSGVLQTCANKTLVNFTCEYGCNETAKACITKVVAPVKPVLNETKPVVNETKPPSVQQNQPQQTITSAGFDWTLTICIAAMVVLLGIFAFVTKKPGKRR